VRSSLLGNGKPGSVGNGMACAAAVLFSSVLSEYAGGEVGWSWGEMVVAPSPSPSPPPPETVGHPDRSDKTSP
jgi:hypothetical protein